MIDPQQPLPDLMIRHTYPAPGIYRACVKILFDGGCRAEDCKEVVIRSASNICGGFMTDSLTGPRERWSCFRGFSIHAPNDEVVGYRWTFGDGSSAEGRRSEPCVPAGRGLWGFSSTPGPDWAGMHHESMQNSKGACSVITSPPWYWHPIR